MLKNRKYVIKLVLFFFLGINSASSFQSHSTSLEAKAFPIKGQTKGLEPEILDLRYKPAHWQACYGLVDDPHKSMIGSEGELYYHYGHGGPYYGFGTRIMASLDTEAKPGQIRQSLLSPRIPIITTKQDFGNLTLQQEVWANASEGKTVQEKFKKRVDYLWLKMKNTGEQKTTGTIVLQVNSKTPLFLNEQRTQLLEKDHPENVFCAMEGACESVEYIENKEDINSVKLRFEQKELAPGKEYRVLLTFYQGDLASGVTKEKEAYREQKRAIKYWEKIDLPYNRLIVPDPAVQGLLDSCIRNIYQSREIVSGVPIFQVGPTCFRFTCAADGPFILECMSYLGRDAEARASLEKQVDKDGGPGGVQFSKKAGLRLWMIWRHAQLTGDWAWLEKTWYRVEREVNQIIQYRQMTRDDPNQANYGLMPIGTGDGGLGGHHREYTNVYWTLAGLKAAIDMAEKMDKSALSAWKAEYQDYWKAFDKARNRDKKEDSAGNIYVPVTMQGEKEQLPQCGAWAFMQSVYPGRIFAADDELMLSTLAMLDANVQEGLIYATGWMPDGLWTYAASFYGHTHLWLGHGKKTAATFYAFGNHACPLLCWQEEQRPLGEEYLYDGDMPHNWASAEFIRMVRHMMILERGNELHLLEGLPQAWTKAGDQTRLVEIPTSFGTMNLSLKIAKDNKSALLRVEPPHRETLEKIVVHLEHFGRPINTTKLGNKELTGTTAEIRTNKPFTLKVEFEK